MTSLQVSPRGRHRVRERYGNWSVAVWRLPLLFQALFRVSNQLM